MKTIMFLAVFFLN